MDLSAQELLTIMGAGLAAAVLIVLILRYTHRPKRPEPPTGLGLDPRLAPSMPSPLETPTGTELDAVLAAEQRFAPAAEATRSVYEGTQPGAPQTGGAVESSTPDGCPKCGGPFLLGEMEGPTLMIDGVAREDFQPLLSARECKSCGYLEFYTRVVRV